MAIFIVCRASLSIFGEFFPFARVSRLTAQYDTYIKRWSMLYRVPDQTMAMNEIKMTEWMNER